MRTWFLSQSEIIRRTTLIGIATSLAIFMANAGKDLSQRQVAATLLIACGFIFTVGGILFTGRTIWKWSAAQTLEFLRWERGWVLAALMVNILGLTLLENLLHTEGDSIFAQVALVAYLIGGTVLVVAELSYIHNREWVYPQIVFHVVLAFLAQAAFGAALLQTELVAEWAGWATIIWNIAWLVILVIASPHNMYFPVLHHVAPLVIGIALLLGT
jgi:hypothetical protein